MQMTPSSLAIVIAIWRFKTLIEERGRNEQAEAMPFARNTQTMRAVVHEWGSAPKFTQVPLSGPTSDMVRIKVKAAGVHAVVRARAAGKHYSCKELPHVPGVDGVGIIEDTNQMVYFLNMEGTLSEEVNVPKENVTPLPEGSDLIQVAAMMNPAAAAWMPLAGPAIGDLPTDFTVLILGATSASGRLAISFARSLGALRIIGVARNKEKLEAIEDLDETIVAQEDAKETDFSTVGDVNVVVDYVYGPLCLHLLESLKCNVPCTYVNAGRLSSSDINLPSHVLRSKKLRMVGAAKGSWSMAEWNAQTPAVLEALKQTDRSSQAITIKPLEDVEKEWNAMSTEGEGRLVFQMDGSD